MQERIIDTIDSRELLGKNVLSIVENIEFYTIKQSYNKDLASIKFDDRAMLW